jgi:hypothetical protein
MYLQIPIFFILCPFYRYGFYYFFDVGFRCIEMSHVQNSLGSTDLIYNIVPGLDTKFILENSSLSCYFLCVIL